MDYVSVYRVENDLLPQITSSNKYQIALNQVDFFAKKFIDLSDVTIFNIAESLEYYSVTYDGFGLFTGSEKIRNYGIYFAAIN
eukprot:CAMPEP_0176366822 /NCGR_PEP_ID=MMETSP0126-20121128/21446_1 /TAXON_ID=141414 ORGANISM="Strombidinopsis acuminatum, Strain SPMC142" /NCGR_SAMPLE_ID=MMETSP0126 /ASSEMBLY_ACC=CAM_ASM_000229 /LENGTH=82 /DNA_ID=CAMNT_0017724391 /DNA_START=673 /DNA_END=921 /DNA_ORIENTATION=+